MSLSNVGSLSDINLFSGMPQHENFSSFNKLLPVSIMRPSGKVFEFPVGEPIKSPVSYRHEGRLLRFEDFFTLTDTAALLVLKDGVIRYERYALTGGKNTPWVSWSVAKSFVSALVGIAVSEGHISSIDEPISRYIKVARGSAYDGVSIKDVLQMSSGARWNESYDDPQGDVQRLAVAMSDSGSLDEFLNGMVRQSEPGTVCRYNSGDTQALGALLVSATKRSITDYMQGGGKN